MRIFSVFFLTLILGAGYAQQMEIVVMDQTGKPIPDVLIKTPDQQFTITDSSGVGYLELKNKSKVFVTHVSYEPKVHFLSPGTIDTVFLEAGVMSLTEVIVTGFASRKPLLDQPAAISHVSSQDLQRFDETSMVDAFNTYPGVRMEERAPNSYRISIRGSSLRSPFGVRNVKVYWNGIPYTSPDGTTALNLLDLSNINQADIIKGPSGSMYGAGNGGVINLQSKPVKGGDGGTASLDFLAGSFGLTKYRVAMDQPMAKGGIKISYVRQKADGYRKQSASDRKVFQLSNGWQFEDDNQLILNVLYSDLYYGLPGALTAEQAAEDRTQARSGSEEMNASIKQKSLFTGLSDNYNMGDHWKGEGSGYITTSDFKNPFNTDFKKETQFGYGGRSVFTYSKDWGNLLLQWITGGEYQFSKTAADNYGNVNGEPDTLRFADDLFTTQYFLFTQVELTFPHTLTLTAGLSRNYLNYDINRKIDVASNKAYDLNQNFDPVLVPRVSLLKKINPNQVLRTSISYGFSPPTIDEVRTNEGSINLALDAEKGTNFEIGYRGTWFNERLNTDLTLFYFKLNETITTYTSSEGVVLFRNAGSTDQKGIEFQWDYDLIRQSTGFFQQVSLRHSYTGYFFKFKEYRQKEDNFSGNDLTGVAPHTLVSTLDINTFAGFYVNFTHQWVDKLPLNDANSVYQKSYNLVSGKAGWKRSLSNQWNLEIFAGLENILNESYSRGNDLNPFGQRYYQPAPGINGFGGMKLRFMF